MACVTKINVFEIKKLNYRIIQEFRFISQHQRDP